MVSGLARCSFALRPAGSLTRFRAFCTKGFEHFIASMLASAATGWSVSWRVGLFTLPLEFCAFPRRTQTGSERARRGAPPVGSDQPRAIRALAGPERDYSNRSLHAGPRTPDSAPRRTARRNADKPLALQIYRTVSDICRTTKRRPWAGRFGRPDRRIRRDAAPSRRAPRHGHGADL